MGAFPNIGVFSASQAITAAAASTNYIDLAVARSGIGVGTPVFLCIRTAVAPTQAADTLSIEVQQDDNSSFSSPETVFMPLVGAAGAEVLASVAKLATAGKWIFRAPLPYEITERYLRLYYNNTTSNGTFTIDAFLSLGPETDIGANAQVWESNVGQP